MNETVALLAALGAEAAYGGPGREKAGYAYVVVDGTLIPINRVAADRPFYSGKHRKHGMNLQVIASPDGDVLWVSGALPGSVHDKKAEWIWGVLAELEAAGLVTLAEQGLPGQHVREDPYKGRNKPPSQKDANKAHAPLRSPGEKGERPAQDLADPPQTAMLPVARRAARQGHPRFAGPRGKCRMKMAQSLQSANEQIAD